MKKNIFRFFYLTAFLGILAVAQIAFAQDLFQNSLLKMDVLLTSSGGVKMNLYTNKPYNEALTVNQKGENEYVILLPETSNSMTASPILNSVAQIVKGISVKTQQYEGATKGYTKITIRTTKPIQIISQVKTLEKENLLSQNDYDELLAQVKKKETTALKPKTSAKTAAPVVKKSVPPVFVPAKVAKKYAAAPIVKQVKKVQQAPKVAQVQHPVTSVKKVSETINKPVPAETVQTSKEQIPTTETQKQNIQQETQQEVKPEPVVPSVVQQEVPATPIPTLNPPKERKLTRYIRILKDNLSLVLGFGLLAFLILLIGARRMVRNVNKQKEIFTSHLNEQPPVVKDYSEKISDDMNWKEKFQTYVEASQEEEPMQNAPEEEEVLDENADLDDLFINKPLVDEELSDEEYYGEDAYEDESAEIIEESQKESEIFSSLGSFSEVEYDNNQDVSLDELLGDEEGEEESDESGYVQEQDEFVKSEFVIDDEKGFYLVDFEDTSALVGHIDDEIFVLKRFDTKIEDKLQARLSETKGSSSSYMTRVGNFKGLVEVTPEKMNLLIEL